MSGWLAIGLVTIGLMAVAGVVLLFDLSRGDIGGGRHTLARARRILVVATDAETEAYAESWISDQRAERSDLQCFLLVEADGEPLFERIHETIDGAHTDAIVFTRHHAERDSHSDTLARLREEGTGPIDLIFVPQEQNA